MKNQAEELSLYSSTHSEKNAISALDFVSIGIAAHALCLLDSAGILKALKKKNRWNKNEIYKFNNPHLVRAALITLIEANVLSFNETYYQLTELGLSLAKNIGLLTVPLTGYRKLFSEQLRLLNDPSSLKYEDIDFAAVASASNDFGASDIDPLILNIFQRLNPKGTVCDLGCGSGEKLMKICNLTGSPGLGIEQSKHVIKETERSPLSAKIEIVEGDITSLKDVWEDVDLCLMSFVCHDIASPVKCKHFLQSLQKNFPRMRFLVVIDIVSPSQSVPTIMPGFDYVHGLQGMTPRNYEDTLSIFEESNFEIFQEISVPNMPNTFAWILKPSDQINVARRKR